MKKLIYLGGLMLLSTIIPFSTKGQEAKDYYKGLPIKSIKASGAFTITLVQSETTRVDFSSTEINKLKISCKSGVLKMTSNTNENTAVTVYVNKLEKVDLGKGASIGSTQVVSLKKVKFNLDGAKIGDLQIQAKSAKFDLQNGSVASGANLAVGKVKINLKKASSFTGTINEGQKVNVSSDIKSVVKLSGTAKNLDVKGEGSDIDASNLQANKVKVKLKGGANATVYANNDLKVNIRTGSTLKHKGAANIKVKKMSEGSSISAAAQ